MLRGNSECLGPFGVQSFGQDCANALDAVVLAVTPCLRNVMEVASELLYHPRRIRGFAIGLIEKMSRFFVSGYVEGK